MSFVQWLHHLLGTDRKEQQAHDIKNQMTRDILEIQSQVSQINRYIENSTAYRVAKASGRDK